jgi:predicted DNA-binding transcriptional regulator AlpA
MDDSDVMLSNAEAALMLGLAAATLRLWRHQGKGPRYVKLGCAKQANVVYLKADVLAWREQRTFANTSAFTERMRKTAQLPNARSHGCVA